MFIYLCMRIGIIGIGQAGGKISEGEAKQLYDAVKIDY